MTLSSSGPTDFLDHMNSVHHNIQFTTEIERDSHLPSLDIGIYTRPEGSLGHEVYHKPSHINLYLQHNSYHCPSNKPAIPSTLVHKSGDLCDQDSLHAELVFLRDIFRQNSCSNLQIARALNPPAMAFLPNDMPDSVTFVP
jgi:hypothetical protein